MNDILIAWYSHSANTRKLAKLIGQKTGGDLQEILPQTPYPAAYNTVVAQAKKEIQAGYRPVLQSLPQSIAGYGTVFVGSPNWWSTVAPPVAAFLEFFDFSGKTVIPFCTHGGGGFGHIERDIAKQCPRSILLPGFAVYGGGSREADVSAWLARIGITHAE
jgi:flavodoxin